MTVLDPPGAFTLSRRSSKYVLPAIASLPTEILIEIFVFCTASGEPFTPLVLSSVSSLWHQVTQSSPRLWQHIFLDDRWTLACLHKQASLWTQQSYPLSFDVSLNVAQSPDLILPILSPILPSISRWRRFTMAGKWEESILLSGSLAGCIDPLVIAIQDPVQTSPADDEPPRVTFSSAMSSWVTMNIWVTELPKAPSLTTLRFTTIVMSERSLSIDTQPRTIIQFLSACPELETFFFTGWQHDDEPLTSPLPVASLPALHTLHFRSTCGTRSLLSSIDAPRLTELYLAHLNVDFQFHKGDYFTESGDSDDEANDFSRSKWSDHATGMGLRRLILRSHPPLKVLDMDWSDMRTKDFKFAFQHLDQLETFFIAASDMSDKVIELFRPYVSRDGSRRVCLPRLKSLELANCNELSGAVLLDVLSARVKLTDNLPGAESLTAVTISECPSFTERHAQLLRKDLGDRLRLDLD